MWITLTGHLDKPDSDGYTAIFPRAADVGPIMSAPGQAPTYCRVLIRSNWFVVHGSAAVVQQMVQQAERR